MSLSLCQWDSLSGFLVACFWAARLHGYSLNWSGAEMEEVIQEPARLEDLGISLSSLILDGCGTVKGLR